MIKAHSKVMVYLIDDDAAVRKALSLLLHTVGFEVRQYADPAEFLRQLSELEPGCILLDIRMPKISGIRVQEKLIEAACDWPLVIMSGHADINICRQVFKRGALDFLSKPVDEQDLIDAIQKGFDQLARDTQAKKIRQETRNLLNKLTPREREIMEMISRGLSTKEIAAIINVSPRTVESHRANLAEKIGTTSPAEMARLVIDSG